MVRVYKGIQPEPENFLPIPCCRGRLDSKENVLPCVSHPLRCKCRQRLFFGASAKYSDKEGGIMNRRAALLLLVLFVPGLTVLSAENVAVSVYDFSVESEKPEYTHIGKGVSRLVAMELRKADNVTLIEREKLNAILEEQRFALSGMADEETLMEIGKLLTADYLVLGEIIDMAGPVLVTVRMVDAGTGEVVWDGSLTEELEAYDYIGSYFATSILEEFGTEAEESTVKKVAEKKEKDVQTVIKISEGIDAYDRDEKKEAKKALSEARVLDPDNEVASFYLSKLSVTGSKFTVVPPLYYSRSNPASLGFIERDMVFFNFSSAQDTGPGGGSGYKLEKTYGPDGETEYRVDEHEDRNGFGYYFPVGKRMGFGVEGFSSALLHKAMEEDGSTNHVSHDFWGGIVSGGFAFGNKLSAGASLLLGYVPETLLHHEEAEKFSSRLYGGQAGIVSKNSSGSLIYSLFIGFSSFTDYENNMVDQSKGEKVPSPLYMDHSMTFGFNRMRTYFIVKNINEFYVFSNTGPGTYVQMITPLEHWFTDWLSFRGGPVFSFIAPENFEVGFGGAVGSTLRILNHFDIDFQWMYREKPSRCNGEELIPEISSSIGITWNGALFERK
jgi:TolB-like protein